MGDVVEVLAAAGPHRGGSPNLALSVLLALLSACAFAVSTVVQHRAATVAGQDLPQGAGCAVVGKLVRNKAWIGGQAAALTGFCLHAAALKFGPVVVVQPLLSGGLVISLALGALVDRRHPDRLLPEKGQWIAAGVVALTLGCSWSPRGPTTAVPSRGRARCWSASAPRRP